MTWNDLDLEQVQLLPCPLFRFRCRDFGANDLRDSDSYCDCGGCHGGCYCKEKVIEKEEMCVASHRQKLGETMPHSFFFSCFSPFFLASLWAAANRKDDAEMLGRR